MPAKESADGKASGLGTLQGHARRRRVRRALLPRQPARVRPRPSRRRGARHGHRRAPARSLDDELRHWLFHYEQIGNVTSEGQLEQVIQRLQGKVRFDRLEAVVEAHVMAAARVRERCGIPGTSERTTFLCRDKPAMKEALRAAGVPCAQSIGSSDVAEIRGFAAQVGFPLVVKPRDAAGASGTVRVDSQQELTAALASFAGRSRSQRGRGGVHRGA